MERGGLTLCKFFLTVELFTHPKYGLSSKKMRSKF